MCVKVQVVSVFVCACVSACGCHVRILTHSHQTGHQEINPDAVFSSHILFFAKDLVF